MTNEDWKTVDKALKSVLLTEVLKANGLQKIVRNAGVSSAVRREHLLKKQIIRLMAYAVRKLKKS